MPYPRTVKRTDPLEKGYGVRCDYCGWEGTVNIHTGADLSVGSPVSRCTVNPQSGRCVLCKRDSLRVITVPGSKVPKKKVQELAPTGKLP